MRTFRCLTAILAVSSLVACAAVPEIPYDRTEAAQINTIGIVTPQVPDGPSVVLASTIGQSFGLIGAVIDASMKANRDSQFKALLAARNFSVQDTLLKALGDGLQAQGYRILTVSAIHDRADFLAHYPPAPVDAYLDVVVLGYGYIAAGITSSLPYRPFFVARARLVRARDSSVLMQDFVIYNPYGSPSNAVTIAPDAQKQFTDFDSLIADPTDAVVWLQDASDKSAQTIDKLLSPTL